MLPCGIERRGLQDVILSLGLVMLCWKKMNEKAVLVLAEYPCITNMAIYHVFTTRLRADTFD